MRKILVFFLLLISCSPRPHYASMDDYLGVSGASGVSDDRSVLQAALDAAAGGVVTVPPGRYTLAQGAGYFCLHIPDGTALQGDPGAILAQGVVGGSVRLLSPGANVTIADLELDGQRALQTVDEHRGGIFAFNAPGLIVRDVVSHGFTGDGFTVHSGSDGVSLTNLTAYDNGRSGIAFTGCTTGASVIDANLYGNAVKALHTEPGSGCHVDDVTVTRGAFVTGSQDWAVSIAGGGAALSSGWSVSGATILGGLYVIGSSDVTVSDSAIANVGTKPAVEVYRNADRVTVTGNRSITATGAPAVIEIVGTDTMNLPDHVAIVDNPISTTTTGAMGVHAISARGLSVTGNTITGGGVASTYAYGVYARSIVPGANLVAYIGDNTITNWGSTGIVLANTGGGIASAAVVGNRFYAPSGAERYAMTVPAGSTVTDNVAGAGVLELYAP